MLTKETNKLSLQGHRAFRARMAVECYLDYRKSSVLHQALDKAGVKNIYYESPGTAHEWLTWRRDLYQFALLLFPGAGK